MDFLVDSIAKYFNKFVVLCENIVLFVPRYLYSRFADWCEFFLDSCSTCGINYLDSKVAEGLKAFHSSLAGVGDSGASVYGVTFNFYPCISYFSNALSLNAGIQFLTFCYILRFVIRRLPIVG